jgi:Family of unknown function (DUF6886)
MDGAGKPRLFHFSEDGNIPMFVPRPPAVVPVRPPGRDWLNGPLVWAIDDWHQFMYLFPRDCPRILIWAKGDTSAGNRQLWLGEHRAVAFIETGWLATLQTAVVFRYAMPADTFQNLEDAGMWVSREQITPAGRRSISSLDTELAAGGVALTPVDSLAPLKDLWNTSLHVSGIRLRNAQGWN